VLTTAAPPLEEILLRGFIWPFESKGDTRVKGTDGYQIPRTSQNHLDTDRLTAIAESGRFYRIELMFS